MLNNDQLRAVLEYGGEQRNVEFKASGPIGNKHYVAKVARAALALGNFQGGGSIVLGIDNKDPLNGPNGLNAEELADWTNVDLVNAKINAYAEPALELDLVPLSHPSGNPVVVIRVKEFRDYPFMCKQDYGSTLAAGQLYTRSAARPESSPRQTHGEIREVIQLSVDKNLEQFWMRAQKVGVASQTPKFQKPASESQLSKAIKRNSKLVANSHFRFTLRVEPFQEDHLRQAQLTAIVSKNQVRHWGWSFPNLGSHSQGRDWISGVDSDGPESEAWRFHKSGQFIDFLAIPSVQKDQLVELNTGSSVRGYVHVAHVVVLFSIVLEFAARLRSQLAAVSNEKYKSENSPGQGVMPAPVTIVVTIEAHGIRDWALAAMDRGRSQGFWRLYQYGDDVLKLNEIGIRPGTSVQGTQPDALAAATEFSHHFGWNAAAPALFRETQQEVMND